MAPRPPDADTRPSIHVPTVRDDQPSWRKVGVIAAIGFVIGVAWPRMAGIRLGPSVPDGAPSSGASTQPTPASPPGAPASSSGAASATAPAPATLSMASSSGAGSLAAPGSSSMPPSSQTTDDAVEVSVSVGHGSVASCETSDGATLKGSQCGGLAGLDAIVMPRLRRIARCKAAGPASPGRFRFDVSLDFARATLAIDLGRARSTTSTDSLLACARSEMSGANIGAIEHEHPRYTLAYWVGLDARRTSPVTDPVAVPSASSPADADATAQVEWEVAIIRDAPKTGKVLARLQRGSTVRVGSPKDGWYPVKYGDGYAGEGWVYRGAIGR